MKVKAITSFSGVVSMSAGEVREISDLPLATDLIRAGYAVDLDEAKKAAEKKSAPEEQPRKKKGAKT